jgi:DNA-binding transcriptional MerR regulator
MSKSAEAFRTIGEVAGELDVPKHVLRFWEGKFPHIRPMKRGGGRRYYRPEDMELLRGIRHLLHAEGYTIKGVQKILREHGIEQVKIAAAAANEAAVVAQRAAKKARGRTGARGGPQEPVVSKEMSVLPPTPSVTIDSAAMPFAGSGDGQSHVRNADGKSHGKPGAPSKAAIITAAIRELELCREILAGSPGTVTKATPTLRATRS